MPRETGVGVGLTKSDRQPADTKFRTPGAGLAATNNVRVTSCSADFDQQ